MKKLVILIPSLLGAMGALAMAAYAATGWTAVSVPSTGNNVILLGAAARTSTDAWAVGFTMIARRDFGTLIEQWNGSAWKIVTSPTPARASVGGPRPSLSLATRLRRVPGRTASVRPSP